MITTKGLLSLFLLGVLFAPSIEAAPKGEAKKMSGSLSKKKNESIYCQNPKMSSAPVLYKLSDTSVSSGTQIVVGNSSKIFASVPSGLMVMGLRAKFTEIVPLADKSIPKLFKGHANTIHLLSENGNFQTYTGLRGSGKLSSFFNARKPISVTANSNVDILAVQESGANKIQIFRRGARSSEVEGSMNPTLTYDTGSLKYHVVLTFEPRIFWINSTGSVVRKSDPFIGEEIKKIFPIDEDTVALSTESGKLIFSSANTREVINNIGIPNIFFLGQTRSRDFIAADGAGKFYKFSAQDKKPMVSDFRLSSPTDKGIFLNNYDLLVPNSTGGFVVLDSNLRKVQEVTLGENVKLFDPLKNDRLAIFTTTKLFILNKKYELEYSLDFLGGLTGVPVPLSRGYVAIIDNKPHLINLAAYENCP